MLILAQDAPEPLDIDDVLTGDAWRPLTDMLVSWLGESSAGMFVGGLADAGIQIALVVAAAQLVRIVARKGIHRLMERIRHTAPRRQHSPSTTWHIADDGIHAERRIRRFNAIEAVAQSGATFLIFFAATITVLHYAFGVRLTPLIAGAGIFGLAVGFGAQAMIRDFIAGMFMLMEDQYGVGDIVDVEGTRGTVESISLRSTRIRDVEGTLWHIPNGEIRRVGNMSQQWARALLDIPVAYTTDVEFASELILDVAEKLWSDPEFEHLFLGAPELWGVERLGDDSVDIRLVIKTQPGMQWGIARQMRARLKARFDAEGVEIPFPQRTVWLRHEDGTTEEIGR